ncbi:MAG: murein L,D-transpeptidase [Verrucomicrobia bacterium]|nr:murein L,D-transpeptidase [Verrucomicrobiota bacterium]
MVCVRLPVFLSILALSPAVLRGAEASPVIKFSLPPPSKPMPAEAEAAPVEPAPLPVEPVPVTEPARGVESVLEMQIELHRRGFSCGSIDGVMGLQSAAALRAWQRENNLRESGVLDAATRAVLVLSAPALKEHVFTAEEFAALRPAPATWLEKSEAETLAYASALEFAAERYRANPKLLQQLNLETDWETLEPGQRVQVPAVDRVALKKSAARLLIELGAHTLEVVDDDGTVLAHFPVSIARRVEKRPVGDLQVTVVAPDPNYTFDPAVFPESEEGRALGRKLIIPPGPNNPVGLAWIGLDLTGYGIHGTPDPEKVGRTESHGCFRLANWDAVALLGIVKIGMPVVVQP